MFVQRVMNDCRGSMNAVEINNRVLLKNTGILMSPQSLMFLTAHPLSLDTHSSAIVQTNGHRS